MINIAFFGECMLEQSNNGSFAYGGDTLNSAVYLSRITEPEYFSVHYITAVGHDALSTHLIQAWHTERINTSLVERISNKKLGSYQIKTNDVGEREFTYQRENSAARHFMHYGIEKLSSAIHTNQYDYFYLSGISLAILPVSDCKKLLALLTLYKAQGGKVIFDNNYRQVLWQGRDPRPLYQQMMTLADVALLTDEDEYSLWGGSSSEDIIAHYKKQQIDCELIIKQGGNACVIAPYNKLSAPPIIVDAITLDPEDVIDTCAAGDSFSAGYLAKRLIGHNEDDSAKFAHLLASRVIQYKGAIINKQAMLDLMPAKLLISPVKEEVKLNK